MPQQILHRQAFKPTSDHFCLEGLPDVPFLNNSCNLDAARGEGLALFRSQRLTVTQLTPIARASCSCVSPNFSLISFMEELAFIAPFISDDIAYVNGYSGWSSPNAHGPLDRGDDI